MPSSPPGPGAPVVVVGLGPAGPDLVPPATRDAVRGAARVVFRTERHPSAASVAAEARGPVTYLDHLYEGAERFDDVYRAIVEEVVGLSRTVGRAGGSVVYAVPGSPLVAERSVALLRRDGRAEVAVLPAPSFLDLAWDRLAVDPVAAGVRLVDGTDVAAQVAGQPGPFLVAQCHHRSVLSELKLSADDTAGADDNHNDGATDGNTDGDHGRDGEPRRAVLLHHLGLDDEVVLEVLWEDLDRALEPDHLTSVWVPHLAAPVGSELVRLDELVRTLRERCPWDRQQTHGSLARHLLEEAYEALDAIDAVAAAEPVVPPAAVSHLEEELGDLLFQVYFHARLAAEAGHFTLADVARTLRHKLVHRHPHVFGDTEAHTPEEVAARWEVLKKAEKGRSSVTEGIPAALPALALAAKLQRKAESLGIDTGSGGERQRQIEEGLAALRGPGTTPPAASGETLEGPPATAAAVGRMLFALADAARRAGVDPETALRVSAGAFRRRIEAAESA